MFINFVTKKVFSKNVSVLLTYKKKKKLMSASMMSSPLSVTSLLQEAWVSSRIDRSRTWKKLSCRCQAVSWLSLEPSYQWIWSSKPRPKILFLHLGIGTVNFFIPKAGFLAQWGEGCGKEVGSLGSTQKLPLGEWKCEWKGLFIFVYKLCLSIK